MNGFDCCRSIALASIVALACQAAAAPGVLAQNTLQPLSSAYSGPSNPKPVSASAKPAAKPAAKMPVQTGSKVLSGNASKTVQDFPPKKFDLLRAIPLEVSGYTDTPLPSAFTSASQVVEVLNSRRDLLLHMEAIRRSYTQLSAAEQQTLLDDLFDRYRSIDEDPVRFFDYGYAQLVIQNNKTGLFFLRKANDAIKDQFSSFAYGIAQVEADINFEDAKPSEMTQRKLDAIFRLKDAVRRDAGKHKPGFWPSYVRVVEKIRAIPAYQDFTSSDISVNYVPYGNIEVPPIATLPANANKSSVQSSDPALAAQMLFQDRYVNLLGNGKPIRFQAYNTGIPSQYRIILWDGGQAISDLTTQNTSQIMEDIDGDNQFELVVRQYATNPMTPVMVYRYKDSKFELDKTIDARFR